MVSLEPPFDPAIQADFDKVMRGAPPLKLFRTVARNPRGVHVPELFLPKGAFASKRAAQNRVTRLMKLPNTLTRSAFTVSGPADNPHVAPP